MSKKSASKEVTAIVVCKDSSPSGCLRRVEDLLSQVAAGEAMIDVNWIKLGTLLEEVQVNEYWRGTYKSFGAYLKEIISKYTIKRSQLYNYIGTAHTLRPLLSEDQLGQIGIAKARVLTEGIRTLGSLPTTAIEIALDASKTAENVREAIFKGSNVAEKGDWFPLSGFMVSKDERETLNLAFETARRTDPVMPKEWKSWQILKETLIRLSMEYISSHPEVDTFEGTVNGNGEVEF